MNMNNNFSPSSTVIEVSQEELFLFHSIDRELYKILVLKLSREPMQSMHVLAFWLWLERAGYRRIIEKLLRLPHSLINQAADEALSCLNFIHSAETSVRNCSYNNGMITVTRSIVIDKEFSLEILLRERNSAVQGVSKVMHGVCLRAFADIMNQVVHDPTRNNYNSTEKTRFECQQSDAAATKMVKPGLKIQPRADDYVQDEEDEEDDILLYLFTNAKYNNKSYEKKLAWKRKRRAVKL
ncbi:hypothetical protein PIB30_016473 [Stylosanthes scabra]|uniref:Uncharacterized protein n=1 Tax=Stylosanthes scabra TaxID=79078 RepID=A0ABU6Y4A5_9FABA|nr:hypothetical protein [Stylosanthes scabra]